MTMLKMSPNLRKAIQPAAGQTAAQAATARLQQVMDVALFSSLAGGGDDATGTSDGCV